jgi:hypothetical protein
MTFLNTNRTYKGHYSPSISLMQIAHIKNRIDHDCP